MNDDDRRYWRGRRRPQRIPRQVILLMIILVAILVMLYYLRAWLDELNVGGGGTTAASVAAEPEPEPEPMRSAFEPVSVLELVARETPMVDSDFMHAQVGGVG